MLDHELVIINVIELLHDMTLTSAAHFVGVTKPLSRARSTQPQGSLDALPPEPTSDAPAESVDGKGNRSLEGSYEARRMTLSLLGHRLRRQQAAAILGGHTDLFPPDKRPNAVAHIPAVDLLILCPCRG